MVIPLAAAISLFLASYAYFKSAELQQAQSRMLLYKSTLAAALDRFQHLPHVLAGDQLVLRALSGRGREELNHRLSDFASKAKVDAIYLMDKTGLTIASSNYQDELTFLGQNYGFRPYFRDAILGRHGEFFAIGATTGRPGYFVAEAVYGEDLLPLGVLAIKLDLSDLAEAWTVGGESVFVSNTDGIVVLSSNELWRYRTLDRLSDERRDAILKDRQFADEPLKPLGWSEEETNLVSLSGEQFLHIEAPIAKLDWRLHYLAGKGRVRERAWFTLIAIAIIGSALFAYVFYRRTQRVQTALHSSQADQRQLRVTNLKLAQEIEERRATEQCLEQAQSELAQASKLAALGQLSASVSHELGQPLAAMRNYLTAAELDADQPATELTANLGRIVQRMDSITKQLRFFAAPGDQSLESFDLQEAVSSALGLISAHGDIPMAVDAMQRGAYSFLEKPFGPRRLLNILQHAAEQHRLKQDTARLRGRLVELAGLDRTLLGETEAIRSLREELVDLSAALANVLVLGETGTGKELVARALHDLGPRSIGPFIALNCATIPTQHFEETLFGTADGPRGMVMRANGGTLFLDEIVSCPTESQAKLLRVIEAKEVMPIGAEKSEDVDMRVISASNEWLDEAIDEGRFRSDLYFRLNTIVIDLPPLRERRDDIPLLYTHFLEEHAKLYEITPPEITADDLSALLTHDWPGNVRELRHVAERRTLAARRGRGSVAEAVRLDDAQGDVPETLREAVAAFERHLIGNAIRAHQGRMDAVAEALGIGRRTLNEKIVKLVV